MRGASIETDFGRHGAFLYQSPNVPPKKQIHVDIALAVDGLAQLLTILNILKV